MSRQVNRRLLYEAKDFPVFQNRMYDSLEEAIACPKGDIRLVENLDTGFCYNEAFNPELMIYDANYQNEQGVSPQFQQHLSSMAKIIQKTMGQVDLVEIGCGKGFFIEMLLEQGVELTGFDPTYEGDNPRIEKCYFESKLKKGGGIILRHVLEHIQDPVGFLMSIREANGGSGYIFIEVPCFDWICQNRAWFDVYYEHVNYFRMADFFNIFGDVIENGRVFGGQYLYVVADLASLRQPVISQRDSVAFPPDFLVKLEQNEQQQGKKAIWGGASKGVIFSLLKSRFGHPIELVIDINPAKQGKYISATGLRVLAPDDGLARLPTLSTIYVMNSNYLMEIKKMSNNAYNYVSIDYDWI